jgi:hypothetical protein
MGDLADEFLPAWILGGGASDVDMRGMTKSSHVAPAGGSAPALAERI